MPRTVDHIAVVLPAFNEEKDLPVLLERIDSALSKLGKPFRIVVVDDGSADRTAAIATESAERFPVHLVQHPQNMGLGRAIQTGLCEAQKFGGIVVVMDADNTHDPAYINDMTAVFERRPVDLVIASRYQRGSRVVGLSTYRRCLSFGCFILMKSILPYRGVRDYSTGFRAYDARVIGRLMDAYGERLVEQNGFACMLELIAKLRTIGATAVEIPYILRYDKKQGVSKLRVIRTLRQYLTVVSRFAWAPTVRAKDRAGVPLPASQTAEM